MICKLKLISELPYNCAHGPIKYTTVHLFLFSNFIWEKSPPYIPDGDDLYNIFHLLYFLLAKPWHWGSFHDTQSLFIRIFYTWYFPSMAVKRALPCFECEIYLPHSIRGKIEIAIDAGGKIHWLENVYQKHKSRWFTRPILLGKR